MRRKGRACWRGGRRGPISPRTPSWPTTRGSGPRCSRPAAAPGAAACTTWTRSPARSRADLVSRPPGAVGEVARLFLKLGLIAFGGPAAHIALMREEVVRRRRWVSDERFLDLLGATNLIPGPNSTEMAIHLGFVRAGWWGLLLAGVCFATPATLIVLGCAWAYVRWGALPQATSLLYGIKPVLIAIVAQALVRLARTAWTGPLAGATALGVAALALAGVDEVLLLFAGALGVMLATNVRPGVRCLSVAPVTLPALGLLFLKVGSILF